MTSATLATKSFLAKGTVHAFGELGLTLGDGVPHVIWAHGWGQDHRAFLPLATSLVRSAHHTLLDFPGFGGTARPADDWDTADYADAVAEWLGTQPQGRRIWVGHSFGCRVGLRLAANHPDSIDAMILVAGAGLQRRRGLAEHLRIGLRLRMFKALKLLESLGVDVAARKARFGSSDYRNAGALRPIFVKVVREDQTEVASRIRLPVALIYGANDTETPPEFGERLARLIPGSTLTILPGLDHHTILTDGAAQVVHAVGRMMEA